MVIPRGRGVSPLVLMALLSGCATASAPGFDGSWAYRQTCGWNHTANVELIRAGSSYTGNWDDGTRVRGENGQLRGEMQEGKLMLRLCTQNSDRPCSDFGDVSGYMIRQGASLHWYRKSGESYTHYVVLHQAKPGGTVPADDQCDDEEPKDDAAPDR